MSELQDQAINAIQEFMASRTVCITSEKYGFEHGSGVAVLCNGLHYIMTAKHVLEKEPDNANIRFLERVSSPHLSIPNKREVMGAVPRKVTSISVAHPIEIVDRRISIRSDSAALLVKDANRDLPNTIFHDISKQADYELALGTDVIIFGLPSELAISFRVSGSSRTIAMGFPHATTQKVIGFSNVPSGVRETLDPDMDFLTDFTDENGESQPEGLSGGGAWHFSNFRKGELWHPNRATLLGIQVGIYRESQVLRLVRMGAMMELLSS